MCKFCLHYISHKPHILLTSCFPHCLHIAVTAMLRECTNVQALENTTAEFMPPVATPDNPHAQTISDALKRDPISIARNAINTIRSSQLRREEFKDIIEAGNRRGSWTDSNNNYVKLSPLTLIRDSPLRWGSTYLMINRLLYLRLVSFLHYAHITIIDIRSQAFHYLCSSRSYGPSFQEEQAYTMRVEGARRYQTNSLCVYPFSSTLQSLTYYNSLHTLCSQFCVPSQHRSLPVSFPHLILFSRHGIKC